MLFTLTFWTTNLTLDLSVNTTDSFFRCMVYGNPFYISVVAPIAVILLVNIIILVMVTISLHSSSKHKPMSDAARVISEARIAFACRLLLGKTWILVFLCGRRSNHGFSMVVLYYQFSTRIFYLFVLHCTKSRGEKHLVKSSWEGSIIQFIAAEDVQEYKFKKQKRLEIFF